MRAIYKPSDYEVFRKRCVEMKEAGWRQKDISSALGANRRLGQPDFKKAPGIGRAGSFGP